MCSVRVRAPALGRSGPLLNGTRYARTGSGLLSKTKKNKRIPALVTWLDEADVRVQSGSLLDAPFVDFTWTRNRSEQARYRAAACEMRSCSGIRRKTTRSETVVVRPMRRQTRLCTPNGDDLLSKRSYRFFHAAACGKPRSIEFVIVPDLILIVPGGIPARNAIGLGRPNGLETYQPPSCPHLLRASNPSRRKGCAGHWIGWP